MTYTSFQAAFLPGFHKLLTEKFKEYLLGRRYVFYTDNNPLSNLATAMLEATEQQWAAQLAIFDYEIRYRSGKSNKNADALS